MGHAEPTLQEQVGRSASRSTNTGCRSRRTANSRPIRRWSSARKGCTLERPRREDDRRVVGTLLLRRRPRPQGDRRGRRRQLAELDFWAPFLRGHPKQFELATRVAELTPGDLNRIFFVNSGSESVESAMKVALAYHQARGQGGRNDVRFARTRVSRRQFRRRRAVGPRQQPAQVRHRDCRASCTCATRTSRKTTSCRAKARTAPSSPRTCSASSTLYGAENIAACFVEPIAGSTGCLVPPNGYLKRLREICDPHGILLVFDEVITGFGRTGNAFAAQSFGVTPDIITMAKGITNGAQPMGAVAISERIHDTVMAAAPEGAIEFFHGYTYSGHPAACAAGLATLDIYKHEGLFERGRELSPYFLDAMFSLRGRVDRHRHPRLRDARAIDLPADGAPGRRGQFSRRSCSTTG